jgi:hypothetical protein
VLARVFVFIALLVGTSTTVAAQRTPTTIGAVISIFDLQPAEATRFRDALAAVLRADSLLRVVLVSDESAQYKLDARLAPSDNSYVFLLSLIDVRTLKVVAHDSATVGPRQSLAQVAGERARVLLGAMPH